MTASPTWLSLDEALCRLVARGREEDDAKTAICEAIAELRLRVAIEIESASGARERVEAIERIELPAPLAPQDLDWAAARPVEACPWRAQTDAARDGWEARRVVRLEVDANDFAVELCGDRASVPFPDRPRHVGPSLATTGAVRLPRYPLYAGWAPWRATLELLEALAARATIPLSEAVSILAFASPAEPALGDARENGARRRQAARALCDAARIDAVAMTGARAAQSRRIAAIPRLAFDRPRRLGRAPDSLEDDVGDAEARQRGGTQSPAPNEYEALLRAPWFNVSVDVPSLVNWLERMVAEERERQLRLRHARRLFERPLWSIETTLCWVAFRDPDCLEIRPGATRQLLRRDATKDGEAKLESEPEIRLLAALQSGKLAAQDSSGVLPQTYWANCAPTAGSLGPDSPSARFARDAVLRVFRRPAEGGAVALARRRDRIERVVARLRKRRRWIECRELAEWLDRPSVRSGARRESEADAFERLRRAFYAGEFGLGAASRVRLLRADTEVVRLPRRPVSRAEDEEDFYDASAPDFFASCWLPNVDCREWVEQRWLAWPAHFHAKPPKRLIALQPSAPLPSERRGAGRPSRSAPYEEEFRRTVLSRPLKSKKIQKINSLQTWGASTLEETKRAGRGTIGQVIDKILNEFPKVVVPWRDPK
jgi:hypothetical protein